MEVSLAGWRCDNKITRGCDTLSITDNYPVIQGSNGAHVEWVGLSSEAIAVTPHRGYGGVGLCDGESRTILYGYMVSYVLLVNVPAVARKCGRRPAASVAGILGPGTDYTECDGAHCPGSGCEYAEVMAENTGSPCLFQIWVWVLGPILGVAIPIWIFGGPGLIPSILFLVIWLVPIYLLAKNS